jgi:thiol:disulfide interchange protein DsbA
MRVRAGLLGWSAAIWLAFGVGAAPVNPPNAPPAPVPAATHRIILKLRTVASPTPLSADRMQRQSQLDHQAFAALVALAALAVGARRRRSTSAEKPMRQRAFHVQMMMTIVLVLLAAAPRAEADSRWTAGVHYFLINPVQPTGLPAGKIEVTEVFSYACPGCNRFYPVAEQLQSSLPPNAIMDYLPASFRPDEDWPMFQRAYLAARELGIDQRTHHAMFDAVWKTGELAVFDPATQRVKRPAPTIADAAEFYAKAAGVKAEAFLATAGSFAVDVKVRQADELIRSYGVSETPSIIVNGKYRLNPVSAGGYNETIELVKWLVQQETRPGEKK